MLDTDGLFRLAGSNFQQAGTHLADCEAQLRKLRARLEKCAGTVPAPRNEPLWQQVDAILDGEPVRAVAGTSS